MGKKKLARFRELESLERVIQPPFEDVFGKDHPLKGNWSREVFGNGNPLVLELGCGKGEYTVGLASRDPERNYLGVDIKGARIWAGARRGHDLGLKNVGFLRTRIEFIGSFFARDEVDELWITFPDPQAKKRRQKKRLTGPPCLNRYRLFLKDGGRVSLKTDSGELCDYTRELVRFNHLEVELDSMDVYREDWDNEITGIRTHYESLFRAEGAKIHFLRFRLPSDRAILPLPDEDE
ncbi:MAG: tRNA (guanosine(46)-N7)-methyltransferase TrmB [Bacteroidales bacterium]